MLTLALSLYAALLTMAFLVVAIGGTQQRDTLRGWCADLERENRTLRTRLAWASVDRIVDDYAADVAAIRELPEVER